MNADDLPPAILTPLLTLAQHLTEHARTHRDQPLLVHEQGVLAAWRALAGELLGGVLLVATTGLDAAQRPVSAPCPTCHQRQPEVDRRSRHLQTRLGALTYERPWHHCAACHHGWSPSDQALAVAPQQRTSAGLAAWAAEVGAVTTFREAAQLLEDLAGVGLGAETLRTHTERLGADIELAQRATAAHVQAAHVPPPASYDPAPGTLVVETDGVMVRYREDPPQEAWHEVKLGLVAGWGDGTLQAPSYVAAREPARRWTERLVGEAARRGSLDVVGWVGDALDGGGYEALLRPVIVIGDGAKWIWQEAAAAFGSERTEIVDWYHATEHLGAVAKAVFGEGTPTGAAWLSETKTLLWEQGPEPVGQQLQALVAPTPAVAKHLHTERGYFRGNRERMQYPRYRQQGLPCGSGAIESGAKHVVQLRLKRPGQRWSRRGAAAVLALRAHLLSNRPLPATTP